MFYLLQETTTRADYKKRWQTLNRAKKAGFNVDLLDKFYKKMLQKGYSRQETRDCLFYAVNCGVFGVINNRRQKD